MSVFRAFAPIAAAAICLLAGCTSLPFARPQPIRALVLNMHAGKDAAGQANLEAIAALVKSTGADVVLLQEVDRGTTRSGRVDQVERLGALTGYSTAFAPSLLNYQGGQYGIAALTRGFIGYRATTPLAVTPPQTRAEGSHEPRVALLAFAEVRGRTWTLINTHLDPAEGPWRAQEVQQVADLARDQQASGRAMIVGGDFNSTPDNPVLAPLKAAGLRDAWAECGSGDGFTYPAEQPIKRIDYLFLFGNLRCTSATVIETRISDHRPLLVTFMDPSRSSPPALSLP